MWKRDESVKPAAPTPAPAHAPVATPAHAPAVPSGGDHRPQIARDNVNIGKSVFIKGELSGSEDLTIEGNVEGRIELKDNTLTIGPNGKIKAEVFAKQVIVLGEVTGNVTATEKVDIRDNGSVDGDIAVAARGHCRGRAFPRRHRHAARQSAGQQAGGQGAARGGSSGGSRARDRQGRRVADAHAARQGIPPPPPRPGAVCGWWTERPLLAARWTARRDAR